MLASRTPLKNPSWCFNLLFPSPQIDLEIVFGLQHPHNLFYISAAICEGNIPDSAHYPEQPRTETFIVAYNLQRAEWSVNHLFREALVVLKKPTNP
jgi:hypothetical protein